LSRTAFLGVCHHAFKHHVRVDARFEELFELFLVDPPSVARANAARLHVDLCQSACLAASTRFKSSLLMTLSIHTIFSLDYSCRFLAELIQQAVVDSSKVQILPRFSLVKTFPQLSLEGLQLRELKSIILTHSSNGPRSWILVVKLLILLLHHF
jgi:hypothetical protein